MLRTLERLDPHAAKSGSRQQAAKFVVSTLTGLLISTALITILTANDLGHVLQDHQRAAGVHVELRRSQPMRI
jgi:hypothetical protein